MTGVATQVRVAAATARVFDLTFYATPLATRTATYRLRLPRRDHQTGHRGPRP
jgi:hypothetical protein